MKRLILLAAVLLLYPGAGEIHAQSTVQFSYKSIVDKSFKFEGGRVIPLTFEQSIETDGDISLDSNYFYYSSNRENGNYDIYLRDLKDITTVRLTAHPSRDTSPAISPDGKRLAFISNREDPEGDLYVMKIEPEKIIKQARESISDLPPFDLKAKNFTLFQDPDTKTIKIIKDATPAWSPDGEWIAFSSTREGIENIFIIRKNGKDLKKITSKGGIYPKYSSDGNQIVFVSYRDKGSNGEVYTIDVNSKAEKRVTNSSSIKIYPSFLSSVNEIAYTLVDSDTNGDGTIDLKDNSVLYYKNLTTGAEYPLTLYSVSSFNQRWVPVFGSDTYKGVLVYSEQANNNININILPDIGIIPRMGNANAQYELANRFLTEFDDREKFLSGLERVYYFFNASTDSESVVYIVKSLISAAIKYNEDNDRLNSGRILKILEDFKKKDNFYITMGYAYLNAFLSGRDIIPILSDSLEKSKADKKNAFFLPYVMEDLADAYAAKNQPGLAEGLYRSIITGYGTYKRIIPIHGKLARISETELKGSISQSFQLALTSGTVYQQFQMRMHFLHIAENEKDLAKRMAVLNGLLKAYESNKILQGLAYYSIGKAGLELNNIEEAKKNFELCIKTISMFEIVSYRANNHLGEIAVKNGDMAAAENYFFLAVNRYLNMWKEKNIIEKIRWLINYYEVAGERTEFTGDYVKAASLYKKYTLLINFLNLRKFTELYNEFGPRAHVLYIDAYSESMGNKTIDELEKEYKGDLDRKKMDFDKAYIYGLGYAYTKKAIILESGEKQLTIVQKSGMENILKNFKASIGLVDWALFLDDTYVDPYILKSWIYQYLDLKRTEDPDSDQSISEYFPGYLFERNISILEKALAVNNEVKFRENEGNIHLNMANNYFLLSNFPRALNHFREALKYKSQFGSKIEEALFYFHVGYCFWQTGDTKSAKDEINKSLFIYESMASGKNASKYKTQIYSLYRYFALFYRHDENYKEAIKWLQKLIDFAGHNKINIDNARFLQEIAFCYKELGNIDAAIAYLDKSRVQLKDAKDDERKYKLKFRVMGLFSFSFLNLGQDAAVIGGSKIYRGLDRKNKELLNIALNEEILSDTGDYIKAIEFLQKKIELLKDKKSSIDRITTMTALNNQGYYYYKAGKFSEAKKSFHKAWAMASDKDINDLPGIFASLMNLSNLYAYLIENSTSISDSPVKEIESLITEAAKYRENYRSETTRVELENLEKKAKAKNEKVTDKEKEELKKSIDEKARDIHYKIDIALGVLEYYRIIIKGDAVPAAGHGKTVTPLDIYKNEKSNYDSYAGILLKFENGLTNAKKSGNKKLEAKLLQNIGLIKSRLTDIDEANESYKNAIMIAEKNRYYQHLLNLYLEYGYFLNMYGKDLDEGDSLEMSSRFYKKGIDLVVKYPFIFHDKISMIRDIYDKNISAMLRMKQWDSALAESEKKYSVIRTLLVNLTSPEFHNKNDRHMYSEYISALKEMEKRVNKISKACEDGEAQDSPVIKELEKNLEETNKRYAEIMASMGKAGSALIPLLSTEKFTVPKYDGIVMYKMIRNDATLYLWEIENGKTAVREFPVNARQGMDQVWEYIGKNSKKRYIILNEASLEGLNSWKSGSGAIPPFMFIPSILNSENSIRDDNDQIINAFFTGTGLKKLIPNPKFQMEEGDPKNTDLSGYSAVIDGIGRNILDPKFLFGNMLQSSLAVVNMDEFNLDYLLLMMESSKYSGIKTVLFTRKGSLETVRRLFELAETRPYSESGRSDKTSPDILSAGNSGTPGKNIAEKSQKIRDTEFGMYSKSLSSGDHQKALIHLNRWNSLSDSNESRITYYIELSRIDGIRENYQKAAADLEKALAIIKPDSELHDASLLKMVYYHYQSGDIAKAEGIIQKANPERMKNYYDFHIFKSMQILFSKGLDESKNYISRNSSANLKNALPANKILLLLSEAVRLFGDEEYSRKLIKEWQPDPMSTQREIYKAQYIMKGMINEQNLSPAMLNINRLLHVRDAEKFIKSFLIYSENEDQIHSGFPVFFMMAIDYLIKNNSPGRLTRFIENCNIDGRIEKYSWLDSAMVLKRIAETYAMEGNREGAITVYNRLLLKMEQKNISQIKKGLIFRASLVLAENSNFSESYTQAVRIEQMIQKSDEGYVSYQLHMLDCETSLNLYEKALKRMNDLAGIREMTKSEQFIQNLIKARMELNRLSKLKEAGAHDAKLFDQLFISSVDLLDKHPEILRNIHKIGLMNEIFESYINFKMKTGSHSDAMIFTEVKKHVNLRVKFPSLQEYSPPDGTMDKLKGDNPQNMSLLLNTYPQIQGSRIIRDFPVAHLQNRLKDNEIVIYAAKAGNDIFLWALGKNYRNVEIIDKGYPRLKQILSGYSDAVSKLQNTLAYSRDLESLFAQMKKHIEKRDTIIFITDNDLEQVPFEIIGSKNMLIETHKIVYLTSIISGLKNLKPTVPNVSLFGSNEEIFNQLEKVSISESGIEYSPVTRIEQGIGHLQSSIYYNSMEKELFLDNTGFNTVIKSPVSLYVPSVEFYGISHNEFSMYNSIKGISSIIINDTQIHDLNNSYFIDAFYHEIGRTDLINAFYKAKNAIKNRNEYKHPAYWAGLRLYLNGI